MKGFWELWFLVKDLALLAGGVLGLVGLFFPGRLFGLGALLLALSGVLCAPL